MIEESIRNKLSAALAPVVLEVVNESHGHNVPRGSETHFRVVVVSDRFDGERAVARHRLVYGLLEDERAAGVHALALHLFTAAEWAARDEQTTPSPACLGGGRKGGEV
jgi:BolA protein